MSTAGRDREELQAALLERLRKGAGPIGRRIEFHDRIGSTNDRARDLAASGEPEGTVVIADEQTRGRGRADREWHSPQGLGLYLSVILRPSTPAETAPLFGLLGALAAGDAVGRLSPLPARIKWPNDILLFDPPPSVRGRKVCGVLTEARTSSDGIRDLVIGFGVNVNHSPGDFPGAIAGLATSLKIACGRPVDRLSAALEILTALDAWYTLLSREGARPVLEAYRAMAVDLEGKRVRVSGHDADWTGTTAGLTADGALRVLRDRDPTVGPEPVLVRYGDVRRLEEV